MVTVACRCGKAKLVFSERASVPRERLICCCRDCRQAHEHCASLGGPPASFCNKGMPADLPYIDNDVVDVVGAEHMELQALREPYKSIRSDLLLFHSRRSSRRILWHGTPLPAGLQRHGTWSC